jgi:hydroxysqualene dehydroxylase
MTGTVHVVGAGMAGLAAATAAVARGARVIVWEMAAHAGGRCRSFDDRQLGRRIDNGNHLILSGNSGIAAYRRRIEASEGLVEVAPAAFPFVDLRTGERWTVRPNGGPLPWWVLRPGRRPLGVGLRALVRGVGLVTADPDRVVADVLPTDDPAFERFWEPLAVGVLNTSADQGAARLLRPVILETFGRGEAHCRPLLAPRGLGDALVEPAIAWLRRHGAEIRARSGVDALDLTGVGVAGLRAGGAWQQLGSGDAVVLATPPWTTAQLVQDLVEPDDYAPILNAHFIVSPSPAPSFLGLVGGLAQWVFRRDDVASVTVSAADAVIDMAPEDLAARLWQDVRSALDLPSDMSLPPWRIVKEKRATPRQTPAAVRRRWPAATAWPNLVLAGDWTATGLPATIEGAVRSGEWAATLLWQRRRR